MKLRILGNSMRLRISKTEVQDLIDDGHISDSIDFGSNKLIYALQFSSVPQIKASLDGCILSVDIPEKAGINWASSDDVGISHVIQLNKEKTLNVLLEKDFACLTPRGEDESDLFPNPGKGH